MRRASPVVGMVDRTAAAHMALSFTVMEFDPPEESCSTPLLRLEVLEDVLVQHLVVVTSRPSLCVLQARKPVTHCFKTCAMCSVSVAGMTDVGASLSLSAAWGFFLQGAKKLPSCFLSLQALPCLKTRCCR